MDVSQPCPPVSRRCGAIKIQEGFEWRDRSFAQRWQSPALHWSCRPGRPGAAGAVFDAAHHVVPFAPGGATDIVARLVATRIGEDLGQTLVIDNRTGGAGNIGTAAAARAAPDGYTLVLATTSQLINQFLSKSPPFNLFTDLVPVALIADAPEIIAISAKLGVGTLKEFALAAQTDAAGFNYGSPGTGSVPHLGGEALGRAMKAKVVHVPFRGSADAAKTWRREIFSSPSRRRRPSPHSSRAIS